LVLFSGFILEVPLFVILFDEEPRIYANLTLQKVFRPILCKMVSYMKIRFSPMGDWMQTESLQSTYWIELPLLNLRRKAKMYQFVVSFQLPE